MENTKKIGIVTGAAGGIGKEFVRVLMEEALDQIWVIGRNEKRLEELRQQYGEKIFPICADLTKGEDLLSVKGLLTEEICISYLINNAGMAQMMPSKDFPPEEIEKTILLNCNAMAVLTNLCIPCMKPGSRILNVSSASAFQPVPYLNLYAATKAFEHSYSRGLNAELKSAGIVVTAVSPGWVDTDMLSKEINGQKVKFPGMVSPGKVAKRAVRDAKKGKDVSICSFYVKCQHLNVKLLPHKLVMKIWMQNMKKYM